MSKATEEAKPLDLTKELHDIRVRLEALEQRMYTINEERK